MSYLNIFSHEQKSDRYYVFTEGYSLDHRFTIGVIVGDEKILVVDSGMGMTGYLRRYIESVVGTDKPIICAVTHGSIDHAGSAMLFDERYCNIRDDWMLKTQAFKVDKRLKDLVGFGNNSPEMIAYGTANMLDSEGTQFQWIDDGHVFDLGGVHIQVIALPGHSNGSVAYFDPVGNYCFSGDAINTKIQIHNVDLYYNTPEHRSALPPFMGLRETDRQLTYGECFAKYADVVRRFLSIVPSDVTLYSGHCELPQTVNTALRIIEACEDLAAGKFVSDMPAESIFEYQRNGENKYWRGHFAGNVAVIYDALKFGEKPVW